MAKFSGKTPSKASDNVLSNNLTGRADYTQNYEGAGAFDITDAPQRLYTRVATSLVGEDKYYVSGKEHDQQLINDIKAVGESDPLFLLQLAAYARNELKLRSIPMVLLAEAATYLSGEDNPVRSYVPEILKRADEPAELLGYWTTRYGNIGDAAPGKAIPNALKKGIIDALEQFDEYQLEKYNRSGAVSLRDVLRLVHPKPKSEARSILYRYLVYGDSAWTDVGEIVLPLIAAKKKFSKLTTFDNEAKQLMKAGHLTWEVAISQFGNKKEIWNELDLPIFATVRNLRNILQSNAQGAIGKAVSKLANPNVIKNSRMLPFRFFTAARTLYDSNDIGDPFLVRSVITALNQAQQLSVANVPDIGGRTAVMIDCSGSMEHPISEKSTIWLKEIAALFGAITAVKYPNSILIPFAEHSQFYVPTNDSIFSITKDILELPLGYATYVRRAFDVLGTTKVDRIILFSDMQCYNSRFQWGGQDIPTAEPLAHYRRDTNPGCYHYSVDLNGYGTAQIPTDDPMTALIAGWSERIYDLIQAFEKDKKSAVEMIRESSHSERPLPTEKQG